MNAVTKTSTVDKPAIIAALRAWIEQRPGLDPQNYFCGGDWAENRRTYDTERRAIYRDLLDARQLLRAVEWRESVTAEMLREAFRAYAGRLTLNDDGTLSYCTGQYFPTEYRKAACAVLSSALWTWARVSVLPADPKPNPGEWLRTFFRREFGRSLAQSWFI